MKVLIDECAPRALKQVLIVQGHECLTVQDAGWAGKVNGELLDLAEAKFDVLITLDTNLKYQQNLAGRKIAFIVFKAQSNRLVHLRPHFSECVKALQEIKSGELIYVGVVS
jgi:predicted nuclease of predicted toxin-antitoxin system